MAGEIGHVIVDPDGAACRCGQRGCLETVASGPHIARRAVAAGLESAEPVTSRTVYEAAAAGTPIARHVADDSGRALARALVGLILTCDLDLVLLGGGVAGAGAPFLDPLVAELERLRAASPLVASLIPVGAVRALPVDFDPVAWGGVALARRQKEVVARTPLS